MLVCLENVVNLVRVQLSQLCAVLQRVQLFQFDDGMSRSPRVVDRNLVLVQNLLLHGALLQIEVI